MSTPALQGAQTISTALDSLTLRVQAEQIAGIAETMSRAGQQPGFRNPDTVQVLLAALADGNYRETACKLAGISKASFYRWFELAEAGDEAAIAMRDAVEKAEAAAESKMVQAVRRAGELPQYWAAAATHLERKFPDRWGKRDDSAVSAKVQVSIGGPGARDVLVGVQVSRGETELSPATFALDEGRNSPANLLQPQAYVSPSRLINGDYVTQSEAVPTAADSAVSAPRPADAPRSQIPAHGLSGDPTPRGASPSQTRPVAGKGRVRRQKEKKA